MFVFKLIEEDAAVNIGYWPGKKILLFDKVTIAKSFFKKLAGLIFSRTLDLNEGLLIEDCNSIHTFWMRFAIDAIFIDRNNVIVHLIENIGPFRLSPIIREAVKVLELKSGAIKHNRMKSDDTLIFSNHPAG